MKKVMRGCGLLLLSLTACYLPRDAKDVTGVMDAVWANSQDTYLGMEVDYDAHYHWEERQISAALRWTEVLTAKVHRTRFFEEAPGGSRRYLEKEVEGGLYEDNPELKSVRGDLKFMKSAGYFLYWSRGMAGSAKGFFKADAQTGASQEILPPAERLSGCEVAELEPSPDGKWIAANYFCHGGDSPLCATQFIEAASGELKWTYQNACTRWFSGWQQDGTLYVSGPGDDNRSLLDPEAKTESPVASTDAICSSYEPSGNRSHDGRILDVDPGRSTVVILPIEVPKLPPGSPCAGYDWWD